MIFLLARVLGGEVSIIYFVCLYLNTVSRLNHNQKESENEPGYAEVQRISM